MSKIAVEPKNLPNSISFFEHMFKLDMGTQRILMLCIKDTLISNMQNVDYYRLYYDGESNTTSNIVPKSGLYYDRILRSWGSAIRDLKELQNEFIITDSVQTNNPDPQMMVRIRATAGNNLGSSEMLYLMKYIPVQV